MNEPERIVKAIESAQALAVAGFGIVEAYAPTADGGCSCHAGTLCEAPGKHPIGKGWQRTATRSAQTIEERLTRSRGQYGVIPWPGERKLIFDVDHAEQLPVKLPPSFRVTRGPDRGHFYGELPEGYDAGSLPATADWGEVRIEGASRHVIGPYSRHASGDIYLPHGTPADIRPIPADLLAELFPPKQPSLGLNGAGYHLPEADYRGSRYEAIRNYVASRYKRGMGEAELWAGVHDVLAPRFAGPLTEAELRSRFERAWRDTPEKLGPPIANGKRGPVELRFYTPAELAQLTLPDPDWLIPGYLAISAITEIDGKIKAAGKTTLSLHKVKSVLDGSPFLGWPTRQARVLYVTEQQRQTFMDALRRTGLAERGDELRILFREDLRGMKWPDVVDRIQEEAVAGSRDLVVIDTIGKLAGIVSENDAGEWSEAMNPVQDLAASGRAVLLDRHDRKSGGEVGESGRGSSQASGDVDIILALRRPEGQQPNNRRVIESLSRYPDTPEKIVVELRADGYALLGTLEGVATADAKTFMLALRDPSTAGNDSGLTRDKLIELGREHDPKVSEWAIRQALDILIGEGRLERLGEGKKGSPYTYRQRESFLSGVTQNSRPQEANETVERVTDMSPHHPTAGPSEETEEELLQQLRLDGGGDAA